MTMTGIFVILGIVIIIAAIAVAFDKASLRKKAIGSIVGGLVLGIFFLTNSFRLFSGKKSKVQKNGL